MLLPVLVTFDEILTKIVERFFLYSFIQKHLVPLEVRMVQLLVVPFGVNFVAHSNGMYVSGTFLQMTWNCIGWQSLLLLIITLFTGLTATSYTLTSKIETIIIGVLGTFLINVLRLALL